MQSYIVTQKLIRARNLMANISIGRNNGPVLLQSSRNLLKVMMGFPCSFLAVV